MNFEKVTGVANITYSIILALAGILFYTLFPVGEIGTNYSMLVVMSSWIPINIISMLAIILGIIGFIGMYIKQVKKSGVLLFIGFIIIMFALVMKASATSWEFIIWPAILNDNPSNALLTESLIYKDTGILSFYSIFTLFFVIGYVLFGIGSIKAKVFPKWASLLLVIGGPAYAILLSIPPFGILGLLIYSAGIFGFGWSLYNNRKGDSI